MNKLDNKGFSAFEGVLIVVLVAIIGFTGWWVWKSRSDTNKSLDNTAKSQDQGTKATAKSKATALKEYVNSDYKFSFKYPENWSLSESFEDIGRGGKEGDVIVTSPNGTKVHFGPNFGGKGGDCWDDQADARTTRTCTTRDTLAVNKLSASGRQAVYLVYARYTPPTREGGTPSYSVYLSTAYADGIVPKVGSELGAFLGTYDDVEIEGVNTAHNFVALTIYIEGKDDNKNNTKDFFSSAEVKEAVPVLGSFKIL